MSTRSNIAIENKDGSISVIYCHWDGYIEGGVGETLMCKYCKRSQVEALIKLGDISSLDRDVENTYYCSYAYRGDKKHIATYKNLNDWLKDLDNLIDYVYLFTKENKWVVSTVEDYSAFEPLANYF